MCVLRHAVMSDSLQPHEFQSTRLLSPWNFPGKYTGVGCHFLCQGSPHPRDRTHISCVSCTDRWILYQLHQAVTGPQQILRAVFDYKEICIGIGFCLFCRRWCAVGTGLKAHCMCLLPNLLLGHVTWQPEIGQGGSFPYVSQKTQSLQIGLFKSQLTPVNP